MQRTPLFFFWLWSASAVLVLGPHEPAAGAAPSAFDTPITAANLDPQAFSQARAAGETAVVVKDGPKHVVWTRDTAPEWDGVRFGESKEPGPRHLRIGFKAAVPVGAVLTRGGGVLSVLKAGGGLPRQTDRRRRLDCRPSA